MSEMHNPEPFEMASADCEAILAEEDRREWHRQCCRLGPNGVFLRLGPGKRSVGTLLDESPKGVGMKIDKLDEASLAIGQIVEIYYRAASHRAIVKHIQPGLFKGWRIGLEFLD